MSESSQADHQGAGRSQPARPPIAKRSAGRRSLAWRILIGSSAAVAVALLMTSIYFSLGQRASLDRAFTQQNQSQTDWVSAFAIEHLLAMDYPALEYAIGEAGQKNETILQISVFHQGRLVADFKRQSSDHGVEHFSNIKWRGGDQAPIGQVRVVYSTRLHDAFDARNTRDNLLTVLVIFIALFFSLRYLLRRTVILPVETLIARTEQEIARALPESRRPIGPALEAVDEIQLLNQRFSALVNGLKLRDLARDQAERELIEHHANLERLVEDRTQELRLAQEDAIRLNRSKSEFLAAASHDLRQPLQAINLFHTALQGTPLNDEQQRMMSFLSYSLTSLGDLLNALLDISKLDAGRVKAVPEAVPVEPLFTKIDAEFSSLAEQRGLRFKYYFPFSGLHLWSDPKLLLSLLNNLIGNAIKYTERGGVLVSIRQRGQEALVQVWDTGIGIAEEHAGMIFEEYFQVDNSERDRTKGLGLGLSIVRRLASLLGTEVRCRSRLGRGTVFEFRLPLADPASATTPDLITDPTLEVGGENDLVGATVVVVEDDILLATGVRLACEGQGMSAIVHGTAESALADPAVLAADFYLTDFRLPGMTGIEFLKQLRLRSERPVNAVLLTGESSVDRLPLLESAGAAVLFKPVDFSQLLKAWRAQR